MEDPIVKEVRKHREEILESYGSINTYHEAVMENQKKYGKRLIKDVTQYTEKTSDQENEYKWFRWVTVKSCS